MINPNWSEREPKDEERQAFFTRYPCMRLVLQNPSRTVKVKVFSCAFFSTLIVAFDDEFHSEKFGGGRLIYAVLPIHHALDELREKCKSKPCSAESDECFERQIAELKKPRNERRQIYDFFDKKAKSCFSGGYECGDNWKTWRRNIFFAKFNDKTAAEASRMIFRRYFWKKFSRKIESSERIEKFDFLIRAKHHPRGEKDFAFCVTAKILRKKELPPKNRKREDDEIVISKSKTGLCANILAVHNYHCPEFGHVESVWFQSDKSDEIRAEDCFAMFFVDDFNENEPPCVFAENIELFAADLKSLHEFLLANKEKLLRIGKLDDAFYGKPSHFFTHKIAQFLANRSKWK